MKKTAPESKSSQCSFIRSSTFPAPTLCLFSDLMFYVICEPRITSFVAYTTWLGSKWQWWIKKAFCLFLWLHFLSSIQPLWVFISLQNGTSVYKTSRLWIKHFIILKKNQESKRTVYLFHPLFLYKKRLD